jgi:DNA ligase D-like protein (predicted 3'-phosphoesterase)
MAQRALARQSIHRSRMLAMLKSHSLKRYRSKRDFNKSPEPSGKRKKEKKDNGSIFVIHKHDASRLHYDFRLEADGVLKSWAIPKGPSTDPSEKRLAVEVEDHPLDYADFEGVIPEGQYGAGRVIVWDTGTYRSIKKDKDGNLIPLARSLKRGTVEIWLDGKKIHGAYALIQTKMRGQKKNWLLIKMKDRASRSRRDPIKLKPQSVLTGRTIEEVNVKKRMNNRKL